jgi:hypothetical protein
MPRPSVAATRSTCPYQKHYPLCVPKMTADWAYPSQYDDLLPQHENLGPNGGMDRQPTDGGLWLGATPSLSDPRSGCLLRRHICPTRTLAWHSRSSDLSTLTLAERICGAIDRLDPPGMPRPYCCSRRATLAPHPPVLNGALQRRPNASLIRQGCAGSTARSARWAHRSAACPWWAAPSIHADLIFGRDS